MKISSRALAPLSDTVFRRIWSASLLSNLGQLTLGVAAAWEMTRLTPSPEMVALVQTSLMLPIMLVSVPSGAIADMFDRRKIALAGLGFSAVSAALLAACFAGGLASPVVLLAFCFCAGAGMALYSPSWQASIPEQVPPEHLPAAIALGSVSYNIARSFGPALGGVAVLALGATAVFGATALLYLPLFAAFLFWRRETIPPRLPPERLDRAIVSGIRYVFYAGTVRTAMLRVLLFGLTSASLMALTPLVARNSLGGDAGTYGLLLGASGVGAVIGAFVLSWVRENIPTDPALAVATLVLSAMLLVVAWAGSIWLVAIAMAVSGAATMLSVATLNVVVQTSVPRWVTARALSWFSSFLTGGIAFGSWFWGEIAAISGLSNALSISAGALAATPLLALISPLRDSDSPDLSPMEPRPDPNVDLAVTSRSGPIVIEVEYRVERDLARAFYDVMLKVQRLRLRNGAFAWSIARDIGDAELWTERFEFPTWQQYLRHRERFTTADWDLQLAANGFHKGPPSNVRRRLVRPFGSVRWRAETPVPATDEVGIYNP
ncbi:MFS transporter [Novosphingobium pentaromativorans]|uniref:Major facilitator superfamily (MFS) profile domain-containing protein n=1 Tax=Novosphingobium pentaromativorans US6-1 TaxID=1088721 RepID=G6EDB5_9SPHN|nr:MFS transporter [Novosphingobium pentaromativorans]AIT79800.1 MFS transporter [Novosphingobium pentaromativorans US6-1]EHJ60714.1 protein of unknown function DUF894 DitE [Novosphingobium pentaromativorans US6-1]